MLAADAADELLADDEVHGSVLAHHVDGPQRRALEAALAARVGGLVVELHGPREARVEAQRGRRPVVLRGQQLALPHDLAPRAREAAREVEGRGDAVEALAHRRPQVVAVGAVVALHGLDAAERTLVGHAVHQVAPRAAVARIHRPEQRADGVAVGERDGVVLRAVAAQGALLARDLAVVCHDVARIVVVETPDRLVVGGAGRGLEVVGEVGLERQRGGEDRVAAPLRAVAHAVLAAQRQQVHRHVEAHREAVADAVAEARTQDEVGTPPVDVVAVGRCGIGGRALPVGGRQRRAHPLDLGVERRIERERPAPHDPRREGRVARAEAAAVEPLQRPGHRLGIVEDIRVEHRRDAQLRGLRLVVRLGVERQRPPPRAADGAEGVAHAHVRQAEALVHTVGVVEHAPEVAVPTPGEGELLLQVALLGVGLELKVHRRAVGAPRRGDPLADVERRAVGQVVGRRRGALGQAVVVVVLRVGSQLQLLAQLRDRVERHGVDVVVQVAALVERRYGRSMHAQ